MKKFKDFLAEKGITEEGFEALSAEETAKLEREFREINEKEVAAKVQAAESAASTAKTEAETAKAEAEAAKKDAEAAKQSASKVEELEKALKEQGKLIQKGNNKTTAENVFKEFTEEEWKSRQNSPRGEKDEMFKFETKAFDSTNVMTVDPVSADTYPTAGTPGLNSTLRALYAKVIGFFRPNRPISKIMDLVTIEPLEAETLVVFNEEVKGNVEITPECVEKPVVTINYTEQTVSAEPVAALWYTTLKIRRFFGAILNRFRINVETLISEKTPTVILEYIKANASPFTPAAGIDIFPNPSDFDAIAAVAASIRKFGYSANAVIMDPISYTRMITDKGTDGHYRLSNGGSIALLDGVLKLGSIELTVIEDPTLDAGEFIVGDLKSSVYVGLDGVIYYFETDGRTDNGAAEGEAPKTGLAVNIRTHEVAQFVATIIPDAVKAGLVYTTFEEVKELIASEDEPVGDGGDGDGAN